AQSADFLGKTWPHTPIQPLGFTLSSCAGVVGATMKPQVFLDSGTLVTMTGGTGTNTHIFGDNTGTAKNVGAVVLVDQPANPNPTDLGNNCSTCLKVGDLAWRGDADVGTIYTADKTFNLHIAATCG